MSSAATSSGEGLALARATSADAAGDAVGGVAALGASWIETAKVSGPTWTRSRSLSLHASVVRALPLTSVPFRLPRSRTITALDWMVNSACSRLTCTLFGLRWHVSPRPILNFGPARGITFPSGLPRTTISCTFMETVLTFAVNNDDGQRQPAPRYRPTEKGPTLSGTNVGPTVQLAPKGVMKKQAPDPKPACPRTSFRSRRVFSDARLTATAPVFLLFPTATQAFTHIVT